MDWTLAVPVLAGGLRNVAGWLENSLKDGEIQSYEWTQLGKTVLEVAILSFSAMYALGLDSVQAGGLGILLSYGLNAIKKAGSA